jgi:hypothetical protein
MLTVTQRFTGTAGVPPAMSAKREPFLETEDSRLAAPCGRDAPGPSKQLVTHVILNALFTRRICRGINPPTVNNATVLIFVAIHTKAGTAKV